MQTPLDDPALALIQRVGIRVRKAREAKGMPRRALSEASGVSPRYLALLEGGEGNISLALLQRVASALDVRIEWLVCDDDPWTSDVLHVGRLFRAAPVPVQTQVRALLADVGTENPRAQRIALIGLRGAGKSTLGALAGKKLGVPFVELNRWIEDQTGIPLAEVVAFYGQDGFRRLETEALEGVRAAHSRVILAVAGGIADDPEAFDALLAGFHTIWLQAAPEEHMARVHAQGDMRPMRGNPAAMTHLRGLLERRKPLYRRAQAQLNTSGQTPQTSLAGLLDVIARHKMLG